MNVSDFYELGIGFTNGFGTYYISCSSLLIEIIIACLMMGIVIWIIIKKRNEPTTGRPNANQKQNKGREELL